MINLLSALTIIYSAQIGAGHSDYVLWEKNNMKFSQMALFTTEFNVEAELYGFYLGGGIRTPSVCKERTYYKPGGYTPIQEAYLFSTGYRYKAVEVGYRYACKHPIMPYEYGAITELSRRYEGSQWECFVKVDGSFKPFK